MIVGQYIAGSISKASMKDLKQKKSWDNKYKEHNTTSLGKEFHSLTELTKQELKVSTPKSILPKCKCLLLRIIIH